MPGIVNRTLAEPTRLGPGALTLQQIRQRLEANHSKIKSLSFSNFVSEGKMRFDLEVR